MRLSILVAVALALTAYEKTAKSFSVTMKGLDLGAAVGHEEITRQAIILIEKMAPESKLKLHSALTQKMTGIRKLPFGAESVVTDNPLVLGNRAADQPDSDKWPIDIRAINGFPDKATEDSMLKWGGARSFHFTLNEYLLPFRENRSDREPTTAGESEGEFFYDSAKEACTDARERIFLFSKLGMQFLAKRDLDKALFSFGVATHVIQDSFSPSHTFRAPSNVTEPQDALWVNYDIIDVCYYDQDVGHIISHVTDGMLPGLIKEDWSGADKFILSPEEKWDLFTNRTAPCAHGKTDHNDFVWLRTQKQSELLESQNWDQWEAEIWKDDDLNGNLVQRLKLKKKGRLAYCQKNRKMSSNFSAFQCLKHEARLARVATMKYLIALLRHVEEMGKNDLTSESAMTQLRSRLFSQFFEGSTSDKKFGTGSIMPLGVMRCDRLDDRHFVKYPDGTFAFSQ